jgi:CRISPR-associated protein Csm2
MNQPQRPKQQVKELMPQRDNSQSHQDDRDIVSSMVSRISTFNEGLSKYEIRHLIEDTQKLGKKLTEGRDSLKTTQVRKFLDAIKRLKAEMKTENGENVFPDTVRDKTQFLRVQLAYAAGRHKEVQPLKLVLEAAIEKVFEKPDFDKLVQLIESIIAYHKAEGGKDQ